MNWVVTCTIFVTVILVGCSGGEESPTVPPRPTPDVPSLQPGEVVGLVQDYILRIGDLHRCRSTAALNVTNRTPPTYEGLGRWRLGDGYAWDWEVYESTKIVRSMGELC